MDIVLLEYLLRLFALMANLYPHLLFENVRDFVKTFLLKELSTEIENESLRLFQEYYEMFSEVKKSPNNPENMQILVQIIEQVDRNIPRKQKFNILLRLLLFEKFLLRYPTVSKSFHVDFSDIISLITSNFIIDDKEYLNCKGFISDTIYKIPEKNRILLVADKLNYDIGIKFIKHDNLPGQMFFLYIESINSLLFTYKGQGSLTLNSQPVFSNHVYFLHKGFSIKGHGFEPIYYNQIMRGFLSENSFEINFDAQDIQYSYNNSLNGIKKSSLYFETGQLIGVIGRSGVGKSTLINLLIGNIPPQKGNIQINGFDLNYESEKLDGLIGYIPQDDLLIEELTVFTNLYLNSQLCFDNYSKEALTEKVNSLLMDLDLYDARDLKVGSPLNKFISGGQRKKLNIALELIREPFILFADEPTSGLSSSDSEEIMQLLSEQTIKGKIVIVNIHQPSSDIFKLFDKIIVLDKGGYTVYFGNPLDSIPYFNDYYQRISTAAESCNVCENINPEAIFKILEEKRLNEFGEYIKERKTLPSEWHKNFLESLTINKNHTSSIGKLPKIDYKKPNIFKQFVIFGKRNVLSKLANIQYVLLALFISPILALVLAGLCRYNSIDEDNGINYIFAQNDNLPSYLFMSVLVSIFVGLIISAEEIIRDRKILFREEFLKLSKLSYLNSKIAYLFGLSALQTIVYLWIGNAILGIQGMTMSFWLVLFSLSCFSNLVGLLLSSFFNSVVTIYIMVPLIVVPQILLSGVVVNYQKLNNIVSSKEYVPVVGDFMASRWAYESLVVTQFSKNEYQKHFYELDKQESNAKFTLLFIVPELKKALHEISISSKASPDFQSNIQYISNIISAIKNSDQQSWFHDINSQEINLREIDKRVNLLNKMLPKLMTKISRQKDSVSNVLVKKYGSVENFVHFKNDYYNEEISDLVLKRKELSSYKRYNNQIIREMEPVYQIPSSHYGRAQFLASTKQIGHFKIDTFVFNLVVIWLMSLILYVILIIFSTFKQKPKRTKVSTI